MSYISYIGKNIRQYNVSFHCHEHWEIIYYIRGNGTLLFEDGNKIDYKVNEIVIIPPKLKHSNFSEKGFQNINMTVDNWNAPFKTAIKIFDNPNRDLLYILSRANMYYLADIYNQSNIMMSFAELILNLLIAHAGVTANSQYVEQICTKIRENYSDPQFSIQTILDELPQSNEYLRKQFIKQIGVSPLSYLKNMRISSAEKLLMSNNIHDYKIYEIAEMSGFSDSLYFSRVFKKVTGRSPSAMIKK